MRLVRTVWYPGRAATWPRPGRGWSNLGDVGPRDRLGAHSRIFSCQDLVSRWPLVDPPDTVSKTDTREHETMPDRSKIGRGPPDRTNILQLPSQLELLPTSVVRRCAHCGHEFAFERGRGRPPRFCSDDCRDAVATAQRRAWAQKEAGSSSDALKGNCVICGRLFAQASRSQGRRAICCSEGCRKARLRQRKQSRKHVRLSAADGMRV